MIVYCNITECMHNDQEGCCDKDYLSMDYLYGWAVPPVCADFEINPAAPTRGDHDG